MNRTSINILTILIVSVVAVALLMPGTALTRGIYDGLKFGSKAEEQAQIYTSVDVVMSYNVNNVTDIAPTDQIALHDGTVVPVINTTGLLLMPEGQISSAVPILYLLFMAVMFGAFVWMLVSFVRFIININRGKVFQICNTRLLTRMALALFLMSAMEIVNGMLFDIAMHKIEYADPLMHYDYNWETPWKTILMGLLALLMAQVWKRGISLREDQELTI